MPDPTIEPTTMARLIHLPSIRDAGSGWVSMGIVSSVTVPLLHLAPGDAMQRSTAD
jgi:hypothetical protein